MAHSVKQSSYHTTWPPYLSDLISCHPLPSSLSYRHNELLFFCQHRKLASTPEPLHSLFLLSEVSCLVLLTWLFPPSFCSHITLSRKPFLILNVQLCPHHLSTPYPHAPFNISPQQLLLSKYALNLLIN